MHKYTTDVLSSIEFAPNFAHAPIITPDTRFNSGTMGNRGEGYAAELLAKSGYIASKIAVSDFQVTCPLTAETWKLEVKTAQRRPDGKYLFHLVTPRTDYRKSDLLLLLAIMKSGYPVPFVIPCDDFSYREQIVITSHPLTYAGMWSEYRQSPHQITMERTRK